MNVIFSVTLLFILINGPFYVECYELPMVISTWSFTNAAERAWWAITSSASALDAVEAGCSLCEEEQCDFTVGYGGSPDENGETTLDAMIMDGTTHEVGSVGGLRNIKSAISVARAVMTYTTETLLVGELATKFAIEMGFRQENLTTDRSRAMWEDWKDAKCQPNFRQHVSPDPSTSCGPYRPYLPKEIRSLKKASKDRYNSYVNRKNHDTIGMIVVDPNGQMAVGTSSNGANHKIPGRVGDSPIVGAGAYTDVNVGGAAGTGDGDVMMRFLPSYQVVENLRNRMSPESACKSALQRITQYHPNFSGALIAATFEGTYGAACHGFSSFHYSVRNPSMSSVQVIEVSCSQSNNKTD